ncbi:MAG: lipoyl synthase [candidate division Zixibacteria bacterium]|nr:lipoyl synthase [candidate division Zixibacteria bacterium]
MSPFAVEVPAEIKIPQRKPDWLKVRLPLGGNYRQTKTLLADLGLNTVCQEAGCPNIGDCYERHTATFLLLGQLCTRGCTFCDIKRGKPNGIVDLDEPRRVAEAARRLGLKYIVVTSVTRDDLQDGGAFIFAETIHAMRQAIPGCQVEVLIPDFRGSLEALKIVLEARPDVLNHNTETVPRLYRKVRLGAEYRRTLDLLTRSKKFFPDVPTKSGIMVGVGETKEELLQTMRDIRACGADILTIGQYLSPGGWHLPVEKYYHPDEFEELRMAGEKMGYQYVFSGPLVRSSYHAGEQAAHLKKREPLTSVSEPASSFAV